jgi:hypothetical protein
MMPRVPGLSHDLRYGLRSLSAGIFFVGVFLACFLSYDGITLPFSNPWQLTGPLVTDRYNPMNDILRFLYLVVTPTALLIVCCRVKCIARFFLRSDTAPLREENVSGSNRWGKSIIWPVVCLLLVIAGGNTYWAFPLDTFHEGEALGPAVDLLHGKVPYKETLFIHGVFRDPGRAILGFEIFGKSIASVRAFNACLATASLGLFLAASFFLYWSNIYYTSIAVFFLLWVRYVRPFDIPFRLSAMGIAVLALLVVAALLCDALKKEKAHLNEVKIWGLLFLFTWIPTVSFANSIDRGFYLSAVVGGYLAISYSLILRKRGRGYWVPILAGFGTGILSVGYVIKWAYPALVHYAFFVLPRYDPLLNGYIYPFEDVEFLLPVFAIASAIFWLGYRYVVFEKAADGTVLGKVRAYFLAYFLEIFLVALSVIFYRRVLGRSDLGHLADSISPVLLTLTFIGIKHFLQPMIIRIGDTKRILPGAALLAAVVFSLFFLPKVNWHHLYKLPNDIRDEALVPEDYLKAVQFLRERMASDEGFLTMTSEPIWYYLLDKPSPIRFQSIYQAMPLFYQEEVVNDLRRSNVKFVLYRNRHWANEMDGYGNEVRLPLVVAYLKDHYEPLQTIEGHEIWIRKDTDTQRPKDLSDKHLA